MCGSTVPVQRSWLHPPSALMVWCTSAPKTASSTLSPRQLVPSSGYSVAKTSLNPAQPLRLTARCTWGMTTSLCTRFTPAVACRGGRACLAIKFAPPLRSVGMALRCSLAVMITTCTRCQPRREQCCGALRRRAVCPPPHCTTRALWLWEAKTAACTVSLQARATRCGRSPKVCTTLTQL